MNETKYICVTDKGKFTYRADNDIDALRTALWFCYRDEEKFKYVESTTYPKYKICAAVYNDNCFYSLQD